MHLLIALFAFPLVVAAAEALEAPVADTPFVQEYHEPYPLPGGTASNDVRRVLVDDSDRVWVATADGVWFLRNAAWTKVGGIEGATYDLLRYNDEIFVGAWDGLYRILNNQAYRIDEIDKAVSVLTTTTAGILALGPDGAWETRQGTFFPVSPQWSMNVRDALQDEDGATWIATGMGLFRRANESIEHFWNEDDLFSGSLNGLALAPDGRLWIASWGGIDVYENGVYVNHIGTQDGLPYYDIRSLNFAPDGTVWMASDLGVIRYDGDSFSLRHSRRWVLSDSANDVAFDSSGDAWIATEAGVSAIRSRNMTLADKAQHYHDRLRERHVRPPGLVEKCRYPDPSDRSVWVPEDDDNDGEYTSMYMVMEAFRYAVTGDPEAKRMADESFEALRFLQTVTQTDGFVARTVIPSDWTRMHDPNRTYTEMQAIERRVTDPRYKPVEERWRPSSDGEWLWKGDTSSDEITGHFYGYYWFYKLAADESRKEEVRAHVRRIMDYLIAGGYNLIDIDGTHTRWGVWAPEKLIHDPDWHTEAPINAFEILSFLCVTHAMTGDEKYMHEFERLVKDYGYLDLASRPKRYTISARTHIDDILLALAAPGFLHTESDEERKRILLEGVTWAYQTVKHDMNPLFDFTAASMGIRDIPLADSIFFLRDAPLDLIQWRVDSSRREDVGLVRSPMLGEWQTDRMLPPSERGVMRWDKNPWAVVSGDFSHPEGVLESSGVYWLLPYWMGRYYGYIAAPN